MYYLFILATTLLITGLVLQSRTQAPSRFTNKSTLPTLYDMILNVTKLDSPISTHAFYPLTSAGVVFGLATLLIIFKNFVLLFH